MFAIPSAAYHLVDSVWPVTARDDEWLVTELCAGFLDKGADFSGDVALSLIHEAAPFFIQCQFAVGYAWRHQGREWCIRREFLFGLFAALAPGLEPGLIAIKQAWIGFQDSLL